MRPGRRTAGVLGLVAILLALAVALLAADVRRSAAELHRQDAAFATDPSGSHSWRLNGWIPWNPGARILGLGDDLRYRRAAEQFRLASRDPVGLEAVRRRHAAERQLIRVEHADRDPARQAELENLLGVLAFVNSRHDEAAATDLLRSSVDRLTSAVQLDGSNESAKYNLELALKLLGGSGLPQNGNGPGNQAAAAGAVASPPGSGY